MIIYNVKVYTEEEMFVPGMVKVSNGIIEEIRLNESCGDEQIDNNRQKLDEQEYWDGKGYYLIPGMIDIHLHGCRGYDFCDGTPEAVENIARYQASIGVTAFAPATMTLPIEKLCEVLEQGAAFVEAKRLGKFAECADFAGINMEGPFISEGKKGAQKADYIRKPEKEVFQRLQKAASGLIKYIGVAPEAAGALDFIREMQTEVKITLAHSEADYEPAKKAFEAGASHVTHLYNGMNAFNHREPGIVGAVCDCNRVEAELICDGIHVHPAVIRATFSMLGKERIILISDSIRATGLGMGEYELGEQKVIVSEDRAVISGTETIAGSVTTLPQVLQYVVKKAGIPLETAVACVTKNPAKSLGIYDAYGSLTVGKRADLVFLDDDIVVKNVLKNGRFL